VSSAVTGLDAAFIWGRILGAPEGTVCPCRRLRHPPRIRGRSICPC